MPGTAKRVSLGVAATFCVTACAHTTAGTAVRSVPGIDDDSRSPIDVDTLLLEQSQMRAITGAGDDLTIIPSMDGKLPVDVDQLAEAAPPQIRRPRAGPSTVWSASSTTAGPRLPGSSQSCSLRSRSAPSGTMCPTSW